MPRVVCRFETFVSYALNASDNHIYQHTDLVVAVTHLQARHLPH